MQIKKVYDLSQPLYHNCPGWPDFPPPTVERMLYIPRDFCNVEKIQINTHTGTHIDVPYHFLPDGPALDKIPVETWIGEGVVIDISFKEDKEEVTADDLEANAPRISKGDIVMLYTGRGKYRGFNRKYLTAHRNKVDAIIGLGDMVTGNIKEVFDAVGIRPGDFPVVGWGNSPQTANAVKEGYVNAATWQYPQSQGYMPIVLLYMAKQGVPIGYDVTTMAMYDKSKADLFIEMTK
jgi:kynurenine formamidase